MNGLVNFGQTSGAVGRVVLVINGGKDWTFMDDAVRVGDCALIDTRLESIDIPAVEEVTVESIAWTDVSGLSREAEEEEHTSRIALSKDEPSTIECDVGNAVQDLVKQMHKLDRIPRRARAIIDARHISHVAIIWQVLIDAVPARLKLYLSTETVIAVRHIHLWRLGIR